MKKDKKWLKVEINKEIENIDYPLRYSTDEYNTRMSMIEVFKKKVDQLDQPELPVIPQFVADVLEEYKNHKYKTLYGLFIDVERGKIAGEFRYWFVTDGKYELFCRAFIDGYTIEPPKTRQVLVKFFDNEEYKTELTEEAARELIEFLEANKNE